MVMLVFDKKSEVIQAIKKIAGDKILELLPEWKQRNLTARGVQLMNIARSRELTTEEEQEAAAIDAIWENTVKPIRAYSDYLEQQIMQGHAVDLDTGWPDVS